MPNEVEGLVDSIKQRIMTLTITGLIVFALLYLIWEQGQSYVNQCGKTQNALIEIAKHKSGIPKIDKETKP